MSKAIKSIQKITRKEKKVKKAVRGYHESDKADKREEVLNKSRGGHSLARKVQRRMDKSFGLDVAGKKPALAAKIKASTVERFDYGVGDFGIRATLPAGLIAAEGIRPNDVIEILMGNLKGEMLKVVAVTDSTHLRLEDSSVEETPAVAERTQLTLSQPGSFYDVVGAADAIQLFNSPAVGHYFWLNVTDGANVQTDPGLSGTGHQVNILSADTAAQVATKLFTAIALVSSAFTATNPSAGVVIVTNVTAGAATDATATGSAAAISILTQGADAIELSESNIWISAELSTVKKGMH